jgi:hypothetical protein
VKAPTQHRRKIFEIRLDLPAPRVCTRRLLAFGAAFLTDLFGPVFTGVPSPLAHGFAPSALAEFAISVRLATLTVFSL